MLIPLADTRKAILLIDVPSIPKTVESRSSINGGGTMANTAKNTSSSRTGSIKSFSEGRKERTKIVLRSVASTLPILQS